MEEHFSWCCMRHYPITSLETWSKKEKNYGQKRRAYWRAKLDRHWIRYQDISNCVRQQTRKDHMSYVNLMTWNAKSFWWWIKTSRLQKASSQRLCIWAKLQILTLRKLAFSTTSFAQYSQGRTQVLLLTSKPNLRIASILSPPFPSLPRFHSWSSSQGGCPLHWWIASWSVFKIHKWRKTPQWLEGCKCCSCTQERWQDGPPKL